MNDEDDRMEQTASLENEITDAARTLKEEYDYSDNDIREIIEGTVIDQ